MPFSVLLIDDDPLFRMLARRLLTSMGFDVTGEAERVGGAAEVADRLRPDGILLDVWLPDGHGVDLARELVQLPWAPRVVLTSTDPDAVSAEALRWSGAEGFIPKDQLPGAPLEELLTTQ
jgi:DNA-binding NarL/FixJ family response regulator